MWILLLLFHAATFSIVLDSPDACLTWVEVNRPYWVATHQDVTAACLPTIDS